MIWIKINTLPATRKNMGVFGTQGQVTPWSKFKIFPDYKPALIICKYNDDTMKTKHARLETQFSILSLWNFFHYSMTSNSELKIEFELIRYFMAVLVICTFHEDPIKMKVLSCPQHFSGTQGAVTPKLMDGCSWNSNLSKVFCLSWLPASVMMNRSKVKGLLSPQNFLHYMSMGKFSKVKGTQLWIE